MGTPARHPERRVPSRLSTTSPELELRELTPRLCIARQLEQAGSIQSPEGAFDRTSLFIDYEEHLRTIRADRRRSNHDA